MTTTAPVQRSVYDWSARALSLLLAAFLAVPAIGLFFSNDQERRQWEMRSLAEFPSWPPETAIPSFFGALDDYLQDHFGFGLEMSRAYRRLVFDVFHDSPTSVITLGKEGFVFLDSHREGAPLEGLKNLCINGVNQQRFPPIIDAWRKTFEFFTDKVDRVALLIPLSKPTLYADKLPASVPNPLREACARFHREPNLFAALTAWGQTTGHRVVYPSATFHRLRNQGNFYPKENYHFMGMSAHTLARAALKALDIEPNAAYDEHTTIDTFTKDLGPLLGVGRRPLRIDHFPFQAFALRKQRREPAMVNDYFARASDFGTVTSANPLTERTALLIANSFGAYAVDHLAPGYRSITWISINALQEKEIAGFLGEMIERIAPDDLLFLFHDGAVLEPPMWTGVLEQLSKTSVNLGHPSGSKKEGAGL